jgi:hypothetical protein
MQQGRWWMCDGVGGRWSNTKRTIGAPGSAFAQLFEGQAGEGEM